MSATVVGEAVERGVETGADEPTGAARVRAALGPRLGADFFGRPTVEVAGALLGKLIVHDIDGRLRVARIVEVEAYLGLRDAASHARRGPTPRSAIMFGPPGRVYVYLVYGLHHCMNVITEADGVAGAVLIRAAEPIHGFEAPPSTGGRRVAGMLTGPGKVCAALGITRQHNGLDLQHGPLFITNAIDDGSARPAGRGGERIKRSARIGVDYAGAWAQRKLRFYLAKNPHVSGWPRD
jgi:DNA-3-methyladenine glycosylase